ncbi:MAG: MucB/RseB C-terminal domain-containing protein, partial [Pseudomonadota bacterium]|nr:MucB/RseB C-terminal domain-containing protein [Pseudomonadota bacterium]
RQASEQQVEHFVLSDGLASVSVYVENGSQEGLKGGSRIGAVHAAGGRAYGHQVTVVGEVPSGTVEAVLAGIRYDGGDGP